MYCPRCHTSASADRTCCPACDWQLSRPFTADSYAAETGFTPARSNGNGFPSSIPGAGTNGNGFSLTPPDVAEWARRPQHRRKRGRHQHSHYSDNGAGGVAVLPEGARWAAPPHLDVVEMPLVQSAFDFDEADQEAEMLAGSASAPLSLRLQAGLLDSALIVLAGGVFFALFMLLGGRLGLERYHLLIYLLSGYSLVVVYFGLFTLLGSQTPGMQAHRLRVVSFDGKPLTGAQKLWRAFGYVISTGSLLLGFVWAAADERHLTWHDHISHTFVTDRTVL